MRRLRILSYLAALALGAAAAPALARAQGAVVPCDTGGFDGLVDLGDIVTAADAAAAGMNIPRANVDGQAGLDQDDLQLCLDGVIGAGSPPMTCEDCGGGALNPTNPHLFTTVTVMTPGGENNALFLGSAPSAVVPATTTSWWITQDTLGSGDPSLNFGFPAADPLGPFGIRLSPTGGGAVRFLGVGNAETSASAGNPKPAPASSSAVNAGDDGAALWFSLPFGPPTARIPATVAAHPADFYQADPGTLTWDAIGASNGPIVTSDLIENRRPIGAEGTLLVNLWFVTHSTEPHLSAAESVGNAQFQSMLDQWLGLYTASGVGITQIGILERRDIARDDFFEITDEPTNTEFRALLRETAPLAGTGNDGFNVVFVNRFVDTMGSPSSVIGRAPLGGPPPPIHHGTSAGGAVITFQGFDLSTDVVPADELTQIATTAAHEIGHYMKLQHPSDVYDTSMPPDGIADLVAHDWLDDTDTCTTTVGFPGSCPASVQALLMHNQAVDTAMGISEDQAFVMERFPFIVNP
ncbi:MAG: hypothetical protein KC466_14670 [Myxococcales bacterium]|nr:hypothetical protein [Myxococcales bacterium]